MPVQETKNDFIHALTELAESEIEREPSLLSRDRGKAANLIEGALDRSHVYKDVETNIDAIISKHLDKMLSFIREIRRQDVGDGTAAAEEASGNKTDEDYERAIEARRRTRDDARLRIEEIEKKLEEDRAEIRAKEERREREIKRRKEEEERAKEAEREEKKRLEREQEREEQRKLEEQREREREERYERRRREERQQRESAYSSRRVSTSFEHSTTPQERTSQQPAVEEKSLEEAALELLLKEGQELAAKSKQKPEFDFEQAEKPESTRKPQLHHVKEDERRSSRGDYRERKSRHERSPTPTYDRNKRRDSTVDHESRSKRRDSRSRSRGRRDEERVKAEYEAYQAKKIEAARMREKEAEAYKRASREGGSTRHRTRSRSMSRRDDKDREEKRSRRHESRSRSPKRKGRSGSRSPRRSHRDRSTKRKHSRSRSPVAPIDRYVPAGGRRSPAPVRRLDKRRRSRSPGRRHERDGDERREERREGRHEDRREGRREEKREERRDDRRDHRRDDRRDEKRGYVEIDRYVPGK